MKLEGGQIANNQLMFLIMGVLLGSSIILNPAGMLGRDAWVAVLAGGFEGLLFLWVVLALAKRFRGQNLVQINEAIFGTYVGKVVSLLYLWYFLHLGSLVLRDFGEFFTTVIYTETPIIVFLLLLTFVCASAVRNGLEVIARCSVILVFLTIFAIIIDTVLLVREINLTNLLPVLDVDRLRFFEVSHSVASFPFGEVVVVLMVLAYCNNPRKGGFATFWAIIVSSLLLALIVARNTAVLGPATCVQTFPSFPVIRLISIGEFFTRLEILIAMNILAVGFIKIAVFYYGTVLGLAQILRLRSYLPLVLPIGALLVVLSILSSESNVYHTYFAFEIYPYYSLPFQIGLPLLSLFIAIIRGLPQKGKGKERGEETWKEEG